MFNVQDKQEIQKKIMCCTAASKQQCILLQLGGGRWGHVWAVSGAACGPLHVAVSGQQVALGTPIEWAWYILCRGCRIL